MPLDTPEEYGCLEVNILTDKASKSKVESPGLAQASEEL